MAGGSVDGRFIIIDIAVGHGSRASRWLGRNSETAVSSSTLLSWPLAMAAERWEDQYRDRRNGRVLLWEVERGVPGQAKWACLAVGGGGSAVLHGVC